jgi:transposase
MLVQQQSIQFSEHSSLYDLIIPKDNILIKINDLIDFSFIYDELLNKYCANNGRMAESPIRMFKYLLLKTIYTVSDVDVVERSQYDMSFKYFLDMNPEDDVINPSSLTKFRKLRLKVTDLLNLLINKTVVIAIEKGIIRSKSIIVDATHTLSRSNPFLAIEVLREHSKLLRKTVYTFDDQFKKRMPKKNTDNDLEKELTYCKELEKRIVNEPSISSIPAVKEKLNLLKETVEDTQENLTLSKDTDAKIGHKSAESSFFGYKTHLAMTEERIITAALVTSGEKGDGPELPKLLEISQENGIDVDTIIGDAAYSGKENLKITSGQNIKIVARLNPSITQGFRKDEDKFDYNKDADRKAKHRYKIEAKNSELKNVHGYDRAISYGITNMQMQGALAIFTVNLKRILKLM